MDDEYEVMIDDCLNREFKMSEGECEFIKSIASQILDRRITPKQIDKLNNIWERVTSEQ